MEPRDLKHLPLKIRGNTVYNVGVSSKDALFSIFGKSKTETGYIWKVRKRKGENKDEKVQKWRSA